MNRRDKALIAYYAEGFSMRETADRFRISLERVRVILRANAPKTIRRVGDTRNNSTGLNSSQRSR